ncbi:MAG: hypothetical protein JRC55_04320 [Deltaproteobacteria bacterium]|nr:hypothetical protein [Deltaproteobacteria bacterium]
MNLQSNSTKDMKFKGNQDILQEIGNAWEYIGRVEKAAQKILNENNPVLESIGFAWVHMMNAYIEIEDNLAQGSGNKLEPKTLAQIIDVLTRIKWTGPKNWHELVEAYQKVVREVAKFNGIFYDTIADACTRRLRLNKKDDFGRDDFLELVEKWLVGEPGPLKLVLKAHCNTPEHRIIDDFFQKKGGFREKY